MNQELRVKNILVINTSDNKKISVGLITDRKKDTTIHEVDNKRGQIVLTLIEALLHKHKIKYSDLSAIEIHPGPGSFTGLRVGFSIANTLSSILKIPINGNSPGALLEPVYS